MTEKAIWYAYNFSEDNKTNLKNIVKRYGYLLNKATGFVRLEFEKYGVGFIGMNQFESAHDLLVMHIVNYVLARKTTIREQEELRPDNERFAFRTWLIRLGWTGRETSKLRTSLYKNLTGNSAFCTETSKQKWQAKWQKEKTEEA